MTSSLSSSSHIALHRRLQRQKGQAPLHRRLQKRRRTQKRHNKPCQIAESWPPTLLPLLRRRQRRTSLPPLGSPSASKRRQSTVSPLLAGQPPGSAVGPPIRTARDPTTTSLPLPLTSRTARAESARQTSFSKPVYACRSAAAPRPLCCSYVACASPV